MNTTSKTILAIATLALTGAMFAADAEARPGRGGGNGGGFGGVGSNPGRFGGAVGSNPGRFGNAVGSNAAKPAQAFIPGAIGDRIKDIIEHRQQANQNGNHDGHKGGGHNGGGWNGHRHGHGHFFGGLAYAPIVTIAYTDTPAPGCFFEKRKIDGVIRKVQVCPAS